jgi:hypothetical protein
MAALLTAALSVTAVAVSSEQGFEFGLSLWAPPGSGVVAVREQHNAG